MARWFEPDAHSPDIYWRALNARNLAAGGVVLPALYLPVINMSKAIIRLSIPIGTIAISSVAIFAFSWVGLALLGF
jgi:hypothetical protein